MVLLVLLLFVSTANHLVVSATRKQRIEFPVEILKDDLKAIENYHENIKKEADALIYLPNDHSNNHVVLQIRKETIGNAVYLKIDGGFKILTKYVRNSVTAVYKNGLLFRNDGFYVWDGHSSSPKYLSKDTVVYHKADCTSDIQRDLELSRGNQPCLSIRYFSLKELDNIIELFHTENKLHLKADYHGSHVSFLAVAPEPIPHFVEYTMEKFYVNRPVVDGKLRVLFGKRKLGVVTLSGSGEVNQLLLEQGHESLTVRNSSEPASGVFSTFDDVYAVRMASVGFLAEEVFPRMRMLSSTDLWLGANPDHHKVTVENFLMKVVNCEPKSLTRYCSKKPKLRPKRGKFQVQGHILMKRVNFLNDGDEVDVTCPLVIESATIWSFFAHGTHIFQEICTDDVKLWVKPDERISGQTDTIYINGYIKLMYAEPKHKIVFND